jgi:hypothetical protein
VPTQRTRHQPHNHAHCILRKEGRLNLCPYHIETLSQGGEQDEDDNVTTSTLKGMGYNK